MIATPRWGRRTPEEIKKEVGYGRDTLLRVLDEEAYDTFNSYRYWEKVGSDLLQIVLNSWVNSNPKDGIDLLTDPLNYQDMANAPLCLFATTFYTPYGHIRVNVVPQPSEEDEDDLNDNISVGRPSQDGFVPMAYKTEVWACVKGRDEDDDEYNYYDIDFQFLSDRTNYEALETISSRLMDVAKDAYDWLKKRATAYIKSMSNTAGALPPDVVEDFARDDYAHAKSNDDEEE